MTKRDLRKRTCLFVNGCEVTDLFPEVRNG